ncbi:1,4-dihydroxy-2-naphthoyl-CoA hydrolase [Rosistilla carotiformis]|uniref:1,4-dihydroxy-2-naphthoyl-CoA hydrolase n=1 Tax=Rosistilla carotiformis TaxID=2528017 RepID=A0A518JZB5_9BACT|nr:thioesterase family protein [Rosistilla carotiformis]QDV70882.1 1,4-dihydroxy-2-naphthoyl-CoA hydrolase [Rosistilla carotiformis]
MSSPYQTRRRIEFRDTDAAGIMHFSAFFTYMEQAEHEMLRSVGLSVMQPDGESTIGWPRVSATCDYKSAVRFEDIIDIAVSILHLGSKSVRYRHEFRVADRLVAVGEITVVCCRIDARHQIASIEIPAATRERLARHTV